jgi:hypothetical protein
MSKPPGEGGVNSLEFAAAGGPNPGGVFTRVIERASVDLGAEPIRTRVGHSLPFYRVEAP